MQKILSQNFNWTLSSAHDTLPKLISDKNFTFATFNLLKMNCRLLLASLRWNFFSVLKRFSLSSCTNAWKAREKWHVYVHTRKNHFHSFSACVCWFATPFSYHFHSPPLSTRFFQIASLRIFLFSDVCLLFISQQVAASALQWVFHLNLLFFV